MERLVAERLLVTFDAAGEPMVTLVHESLIRSWPRLGRWVDDVRDDLRVLERLGRDAADWTSRHESPDLLLRGSELGLATAVAKRHAANLDHGQRRFLDASSLANARVRAKRRLVKFVLVASTVMSLIAAVVTFRQLQRAELTDQRSSALAMAIGAEAWQHLDPVLALRLADEAIAAAPVYSPEAAAARLKASFVLASQPAVAITSPPSAEPALRR